jgi:hypothetical protein
MSVTKNDKKPVNFFLPNVTTMISAGSMLWLKKNSLRKNRQIFAQKANKKTNSKCSFSCTKIYHNIDFKQNRQFFRRKGAKIAINSYHNFGLRKDQFNKLPLVDC